MTSTLCRLIGVILLFQGSLTESAIHMREIFAPTIEARAAAFILAHNHPSGNVTPSPEDNAMTGRVIMASKILGIPLLDHVIVGFGGEYTSMKASGRILDW